ncbi:polymeric immunoglobulin receptor-like isoform X2 [Anabas testudineus]|uniref:polymeric immunoglobulin receptor-like isoform X2 n=1 Tax=Anabas testudineus TaxID=64144 RepID=UPI000E45C901|nr:polymeric immunoglobulin receptor-like isoform X2 [Anabas testudineus]
MKILLLFFFPLMTGCETTSGLKGCVGGWTEFRCKYPKTNGQSQSIQVTSKDETLDEWERKDRFQMYNDKTNKTVRVVIRQLKKTDAGSYNITFNNRTACTVNLEVKDNRCQEFNQTAYEAAKTTITCNNTAQHVKNRFYFFSKVNSSGYDEMLSNWSNRFTLKDTNSSLILSISNVSSKDAGVYWCGVKSKEGNYSKALRKIHLRVKGITSSTVSPTIGQNFSFWCKYPENVNTAKFICKGEDPSICQRLATTNYTTNRFSMKDNTEKTNITVTVTEVTAEDAGIYWCGAERTNSRTSNTFFHRLSMTVVTPTPPTSTQSTTDEPPGRSHTIMTVIMCALLLLLVLILILIYKRIFCSTNRRNETATQHNREDYDYEEMQESLQKPGSETAATAFYATVNVPTDQSDSLCYSTINFQKSSFKAGGEAAALKPSSSVCEYDTVKHKASPIYSTVRQPSSSAEPLYSTVNKTKQQ